MADYTTEQILDLLERKGGAANLDLTGQDLTGINLSGEVLEELLEETGYPGHGRGPTWFEPWTKGISLSHAQMRDAQLKMADLRNACMEHADLRNADISGAFLQDATLENANLQRANLTGAVLSHTILWSGRPTLEGVYLYGAQIEFTPCTRDQFGAGIGEELDRDWLRARESYLALRHNFLDLGRYTDASWAYRKERRMERAAAFPSEEGDRWVRDELLSEQQGALAKLPQGLLRRLLYLRLYTRPQRGVPVRRGTHFGNWLQDATCEYGENPWRLGLWALGVILLFAVVHFLADLLAGSPVSLATAAGPAEVWEYLAFSMQSFASMSLARAQPATSFAAVLASLEALIGMGILALFMYTLGRRMSGN